MVMHADGRVEAMTVRRGDDGELEEVDEGDADGERPNNSNEPNTPQPRSDSRRLDRGLVEAKSAEESADRAPFAGTGARLVQTATGRSRELGSVGEQAGSINPRGATTASVGYDSSTPRPPGHRTAAASLSATARPAIGPRGRSLRDTVRSPSDE